MYTCDGWELTALSGVWHWELGRRRLDSPEEDIASQIVHAAEAGAALLPDEDAVGARGVGALWPRHARGIVLVGEILGAVLAEEDAGIARGRQRWRAGRDKEEREQNATLGRHLPGHIVHPRRPAGLRGTTVLVFYFQQSCSSSLLELELAPSRRTKTSIEQNRTNDNKKFCTAVHTGLLNQSVLKTAV